MDFFSWFSPDLIGKSVVGILYGVIVISIIVTLGIIARNKIKFKYYGIIYKRREKDPVTGEPQSKKIEGKAGYFKDKQGATTFKIKHGWRPWDVVQTRELPNPEYMGENNEVIYLQYDKDNLIQAKKDIDWQLNKLNINPISDNLKWSAQQDILAQERTLYSGDTLKRRLAELGAIVLIIIAGIIVFYFNTQAC